MKKSSLILHKIRRFGRVVGAPIALFMFFATVLTNIGNVIRLHQDDSKDMASAGKLPYESPSFDIFKGVLTSDAQAGVIDSGGEPPP